MDYAKNVITIWCRTTGKARLVDLNTLALSPLERACAGLCRPAAEAHRSAPSQSDEDAVRDRLRVALYEPQESAHYRENDPQWIPYIRAALEGQIVEAEIAVLPVEKARRLRDALVASITHCRCGYCMAVGASVPAPRVQHEYAAAGWQWTRLAASECWLCPECVRDGDSPAKRETRMADTIAKCS